MVFLKLPFFEFIRLNFGFRACFLLKRSIRLMNKNIKIRIKILFLKTCFKEYLVPIHLIKFLNYKIDIMDRSVNNINTMKNLKHGFVQKILRFEVNYSHRQLSTLQYELYKNYRNINSVLPIDICDSFFRYQENKFAKNWHEENVRIIKKIERLRRITTYDKCKHILRISSTHSP